MNRPIDMRKARAVELAARHTQDAGHVLEVSCGAGIVLLELQRAGYRVTGTNYSKYEGESPLLDIRHGADLLRGLPFEDGSFDTVLLLDVMEHLADHDRALSELTRVCKPGGVLIVMTPNMMKLASRLHFLLTGFFKLKRAFIGFDVPQESSFAFHNHPVHLPVFLYQIHARGLSLVEFTAAGYKMKSFVFYVLLWPAVAIASWLNLRFGERNIKGTAHAARIRRCLMSAAGLCGEFLFVVARKNNFRASPSETVTALPKWSTKWQREGSP